jgi:RNase P subunit RPR2
VSKFTDKLGYRHKHMAEFLGIENERDNPSLTGFLKLIGPSTLRDAVLTAAICGSKLPKAVAEAFNEHVGLSPRLVTTVRILKRLEKMELVSETPGVTCHSCGGSGTLSVQYHVPSGHSGPCTCWACGGAGKYSRYTWIGETI